ncbi:right-handed parallel beta-helix repeat-containing protein [Mucilaginibacter pallidiroseus]|uniref:Right-handed parallel beta-helix repeat-containing protein n=1 Tax=Mucilaginibacter pallidiroseus TaxID=2599295 RepID=A0A563UE31_9SPHI|nr:right-handed parallel beta-helix repeat-containing protein [Mucilaginibacter pallidiroseus]TWR29600.1 right-handed parallel beta-helix repeat-containing protein [Mucilaginibacter pallidiroseus]
MKFKQTIAAIILSATVFAGCEKANIDVDTTPTSGSAIGEVSGVWTKGSVHEIKGDIIIPEGKSLTIEEGVTVLMDVTAKPEIVVKGNLYSLGTIDNPVKFTVSDAYRTAENKFGKLWGGILAAPTCAELVLDYTVLEYGGATTSDASTSVKMGLYKATAGENLPALWFSNVNGKLIVQHSTIRNFQEDCTYIEGGKIIFANNLFYTTGVSGGEAMNFKSGCLADVAYNLIYATNTNALKLSNAGDRTPQAYIISYNNTMINTGWRRPTAKGGSVWLEATVRADTYNNLFTNTRFGIKHDPKKLEDNRSKNDYNWYYGFDQATVDQFQVGKNDVVEGGGHDVRGTKAGENDPKFVNFPLNNPVASADFNIAWDFHLQGNSPALGKGTTSFTRHHKAGITLSNGLTYVSPEPATYVGAYGTKL